MAEIAIRDLQRSDYEALSKIIDDEWRFNLYSKKYGQEIATLYFIQYANGSNVAKTLLVDGEPCGILILKEMPGEKVDLSEEYRNYKDSLEHLVDTFDQCERDMDEFERVYNEFASKYKKPEWAELGLLILSDKHKGLGLGRKLIDEARRCASERGMTGLFFYTDTDCNFGFYDHMGAVRIGQEDIICVGEPLTVFGYYLEYKTSTDKNAQAHDYIDWKASSAYRDAMAEVILGKDVSAEVYAELRTRIERLKSKGVTPGLAVVLVGDDPASQVYVRKKGEMCEELGMKSITIRMPADTTQEQLMAKVDELNKDDSIHGFLVQLPLPSHLDEEAVINAINPKKDVDCFHPSNVGRVLIGNPDFLPATPAGVVQILKKANVETAGKHVVVVGRSNIVGKPMAAIMVQKGAGADSTVTVVHSRTKNLPEMTRMADILIVAIGKPRFITADMVKEGAVVIDVGTNRVEDPTSPKGSRLVGDVDFDNVKEKASVITPVPGGVGPMTICMLMANAVKAAEKASEVKQ